MDILLISGIILLTAISTVLVWLNLPGTFLLLSAAFLMGLYTDFQIITKNILFLALAICILLEIIEFLLITVTVKLYGGKNSSAFLSIIGGFAGAIIGSFLLPIIGTFIGLIAGSYFITYQNERKTGKTKQEAARIARSSTLGYIASKGLKTLAMLIFILTVLSAIQ